MSIREVPVLIVGGSLVGMTQAMLLAGQGVRPLVVERHRGTAIHPRAALINQRTMEIFRAAGLEPAIAARSEEQFQQDGAVVGMATLAGPVQAAYIANLNEGVTDVSPCRRLFITQKVLEPLLQSRAAELGAELCFATELVSVEQDGEGVTARLRHRDSGEITSVRARYLVAADGAHSGIRDGLGIAMRGRGTFSHSVTIYFRAEVGPLLAGRNLSIIMITNPVLNGFFRIEKPYRSGFLAVHAVGDPAHPDTDVATGLTAERARALLRAALGDPDLPVEIESTMPWQARADVAERWRQGRIFLVGDAAHVMPPYGGFGGNTGIHDAQNLAWKLAMVLDGTADPCLLDSYEPERRPVAALTVEQAYTRYVARAARYLGTDGTQAQLDDLEIELGHVLGGTPCHENPRASRGRPGTRAPHVWLERDGKPISSLDLYGHGFVLLGMGDAAGWGAAAAEAAARLGLPLAFVRPGANGLADPGGTLPAAHGLGPDGAVLVRPDGFVAWRGAGAPSAEAVGRALAVSLGRA